MTQEVQVLKPNPSKLDIGLTPGRRRAHRFAKKAVEEGTALTEIKELNLDPEVILNILPPFPNMYLTDPEDENTLKTLCFYLEQRIAARNSALEDLEKRRFEVRGKIEESVRMIRELQQEVEDKEMIISQHTLDKEKVKEKYITKMAATREKLAREAKTKYSREREELQVRRPAWKIVNRFLKQ